MKSISQFSSRPTLAALLIGMLLLMPGCGGCGNPDSVQTQQEKEKAEREKKKEEEEKEKKPNFEIAELSVQPADLGNELNKERDRKKDKKESSIPKIGYVKPGHWTTGSLPIIANNFDFRGNLVAQALDLNRNQIPTENTNYFLTVSRPVSLPKEQQKEIEMAWYVPRRYGKASGVINLKHDLQNQAGRLVETRIQGASLMPDYQYYMVVLSNTPGAFKYLDLLDSINSPTASSEGTPLQFFRVTYPQIRQRVPLPDHALNWTSIAYLIWDDLDPDLLSPDQQTAMLDWLHFGGQLIVSGPEGMAKLKSSFLDEYLPVRNAQAKNLLPVDVVELNKHWAIPVAKKSMDNGKKANGSKTASEESKAKETVRELKLTSETTLAGVQMELSDVGAFMKNTGQLVAECRVGRGRIVVAGFSIRSRQVINWGSWDSFFNNCLLRRPAKIIFEDDYTNIQFRWLAKNSSIRDPLQSTTLRLLSRDLAAGGSPVDMAPRDDPIEMSVATSFSQTKGTVAGQGVIKETEISEGSPSGYESVNQSVIRELSGQGATQLEKLEDDVWRYGGFQNSSQSGVAGWNDSSGISNAARETLRESSGIQPPSSSFVLKVLGGYLLVLVPLNWLVFRLLGRLEWAWIAAPIIAIGGAILVVRLASLDIGFARSRTEIAVYELYGGYSRGHLTRYTALYSSLASDYQMEFDEGATQAQPFATSRYRENETNYPETEVEFRREDKWFLKSFRVQSNSTALLHSEQMHDNGGSIQLEQNQSGDYSLTNSSGLSLQDVGVLRRDAEGVLWKAWLGDLPSSDQAKAIDFQSYDSGKLSFTQWSNSSTAQSISSMAAELFAEHDLDLDDYLSRQEVSDLPKVMSVFNLGDQGVEGPPNGKLNRAEFRKCLVLSGAGDEISLGTVFEMVSRKLQLGAGESRLIGWTASDISGARITPAASQETNRTFVLVHLQPGELSDPKPDLNTRLDFQRREQTRIEF